MWYRGIMKYNHKRQEMPTDFWWMSLIQNFTSKKLILTWIWKKWSLDLAGWDKCSWSEFFRTKRLFFQEDAGIWHQCDAYGYWPGIMEHIFCSSIVREEKHQRHWLESPWWALAFFRSFARSSLSRANFFQFLTSKMGRRKTAIKCLGLNFM